MGGRLSFLLNKPLPPTPAIKAWLDGQPLRHIGEGFAGNSQHIKPVNWWPWTTIALAGISAAVLFLACVGGLYLGGWL